MTTRTLALSLLSLLGGCCFGGTVEPSTTESAAPAPVAYEQTACMHEAAGYCEQYGPATDARTRERCTDGTPLLGERCPAAGALGYTALPGGTSGQYQVFYQAYGLEAAQHTVSLGGYTLLPGAPP